MQVIEACHLLLLLAWLLPRIKSETKFETKTHLETLAHSGITEPRSAREIYFRNVAPASCSARIGTLLVKGTCDTLASCIVNAGEVVGVCPDDAICCLVKNTCGQVSSTRVTYFTSPNYPNMFTSNSNCEVRIRPYVKSRTCQAHLEFVSFDLAQPSQNGVCETDSLTITGSDPNYAVPVLCGDNTDQHMFLRFTSYGGEIVLRVKATNRNWIIRITQIPCTAIAELPPAGCLQFFNSSSGTAKSFNRGTTVSHNLANQNYDICLRPVTANCSYQWTPTAFDITAVPVNAAEECLMDDYISVLSARSILNNGMAPTILINSVICGQNGASNENTLTRITTFDSNRMRVFFNDIAEGEGFSFNFFVNCSRAILVSAFSSLIS